MTVLIAIVICCLTKTLYAQSPCITPNGEVAKCIPIKECNIFLDVLKDRFRKPSSVTDFMRESSCGSDNEPSVCCGSFNHSIESTPPNADPTKHKNFHLLPKNCGLQEVDERVQEGEAEAQLEEFPWMVLLEYPNREGKQIRFLCGGTLINSQYILTAAHCMSIPEGVPFSVRLGDHDLSSEIDCRKKIVANQNYELCINGYEDIPIDINRIFLHTGFRHNHKMNDIALIRLARPVTINTSIRPICLPINGEESPPKKRSFVAGWGNTAYVAGRISKDKRKVQLPIVALNICKEVYSEDNFGVGVGVNITEQQLCAGGEKNMDLCNGDGGNALMTPKEGSVPSQWYIEGIVSFGFVICGTEGIPTVFTKVSSYINWILDHIEE